MDTRFRKKPSNEEDRISTLPMELIECILEKLTIDEIVKTSGLSRNWRHKWVCVKNLIFDAQFSDHLEFETPSFADHYSIIRNLLRRHDGPIQSFNLYVPRYCDSEKTIARNVHTYLRILSRKGVKQLTIQYSEGVDFFNEKMNWVLNPIYSCVELTHFAIKNGGFSIDPAFVCFNNLVSLHFQDIYFYDDSFEVLTSGCPSLESLTLMECFGPKVFDICFTSLKHLAVFEDELGCIIDINAKNLETLHFRPYGADDDDDDDDRSRVRLLTTFNLLKKLKLDGPDFRKTDEISLLFQLLHSAPNLQELEMSTYTEGDNMESTIKLLEANMNKMLEQLRFVKIGVRRGLEDELLLVKLLLALCPSLEKMIVGLQYSSDVEFAERPKFYNQISSKVMQFSRASAKAQLLVQDLKLSCGDLFS